MFQHSIDYALFYTRLSVARWSTFLLPFSVMGLRLQNQRIQSMLTCQRPGWSASWCPFHDELLGAGTWTLKIAGTANQNGIAKFKFQSKSSFNQVHSETPLPVSSQVGVLFGALLQDKLLDAVHVAGHAPALQSHHGVPVRRPRPQLPALHQLRRNVPHHPLRRPAVQS